MGRGSEVEYNSFIRKFVIKCKTIQKTKRMTTMTIDLKDIDAFEPKTKKSLRG